MKRRLAGSAVAGLVAASLLVTACSSDADGGDDGAAAPIEGAGGAGETGEDPTPEEPAGDPTPEDDGIDRPEIRVADDLEMVFEEPETDDPVERAIILDSQRQLEAVYEVVTNHEPENESISFYTQGNALLREMGLIDIFLEERSASAGRMFYFDWGVEILDRESALVTFCRDYSEIYTKDFATGEVIEEADGEALPTRYVNRVELGDNGVWQTHEKEAEVDSPRC
ncbi:hypothetical protein GCM10027160_14430 [Streptomyces calidiresistens]|uniref:Lipoprotein n=1 Tax=Streptomyces calidiresistens TaxID=1485586 RepID=A0A7W3XW06_9ACTN|nr:hypothetical protein [Streptomyces calidiresistens]MBB0229237.1 hypothetical protein [Streptomyces calidiresistens]